MKIHLFSVTFLFLVPLSEVFSQVDTIEYSLNAYQSGDSLIFQFNGTRSMNFSFAKNQKWNGEKFRMWNANYAFIIERINFGEAYLVSNASGETVAIFYTKPNGIPDKITLENGLEFQFVDGTDRNWKLSSNKKIYQVIRPQGLRKKPKKRHVILYNQVSNENTIQLIQSLSHIGLLHYAFVKEQVRNDVNFALQIINHIL